jgi:hypothetical protein
MVMSKSVTSPHAFSVVEVDYANVDLVRTRSAVKSSDWKAERRASVSRTCRSSPARSSTRSAEFPHLNASLERQRVWWSTTSSTSASPSTSTTTGLLGAGGALGRDQASAPPSRREISDLGQSRSRPQAQPR